MTDLSSYDRLLHKANVNILSKPLIKTSSLPTMSRHQLNEANNAMNNILLSTTLSNNASVRKCPSLNSFCEEHLNEATYIHNSRPSTSPISLLPNIEESLNRPPLRNFSTNSLSLYELQPLKIEVKVPRQKFTVVKNNKLKLDEERKNKVLGKYYMHKRYYHFSHVIIC